MSTSDLMKSKERECELNIPISGHSFGFIRQQAGFSSLCTHQSPIMVNSHLLRLKGSLTKVKYSNLNEICCIIDHIWWYISDTNGWKKFLYSDKIQLFLHFYQTLLWCNGLISSTNVSFTFLNSTLTFVVLVIGPVVIHVKKINSFCNKTNFCKLKLIHR